jgi:hypothetical protein
MKTKLTQEQKQWNKKVKALKFTGIDVSLEISLFEYNVISAPFYDDKHPQTDEYFVVYSIGNNRFDTGYKQERELNALINGTDWMDEKEVENFLSCNGTTKEVWLAGTFVVKLHDLINYYGYENIMGTSYTEGLTEKEVRRRYLK